MKKIAFSFVVVIFNFCALAQNRPQLFIPEGKGYSFLGNEDKIFVDGESKYAMITTSLQKVWIIHKNKVVKTITPPQNILYNYQRYGFGFRPNEYYEISAGSIHKNYYDSVFIKNIITDSVISKQAIKHPHDKWNAIKHILFINDHQLAIVYSYSDTLLKVNFDSSNSFKVFLYDLKSHTSKELFYFPSSSFKLLSLVNESVLSVVAYTKSPIDSSKVDVSQIDGESTYFVNIRNGKLQHQVVDGVSHLTPVKQATTIFWRNDSLYLLNTATQAEKYLGKRSDGIFMHYTFKGKNLHVIATTNETNGSKIFLLDNLGIITDSLDISTIKYLPAIFAKEKGFHFFSHKFAVHEKTSTILFTNSQDIYSVDLVNHRISHTHLGSVERLRDRQSMHQFIQKYRPLNFNSYKLNLKLNKIITSTFGEFDEPKIRKHTGDTGHYNSFIIFQNRVRPMTIDYYENYFPIKSSIGKQLFDHALIDLKKGDVIHLPTLEQLHFEKANYMKCFDSLTAVFTDFRGDYSKTCEISFLANTTGTPLNTTKIKVHDIEQADFAHTFYVLKSGTIFKYNVHTQSAGDTVLKFDTTQFYPHFIRYHKHAQLLVVTSISNNGSSFIYSTVNFKLVSTSKILSFASQHLFGDYWITQNRKGTHMDIVSLTNDSILFKYYPLNDTDWIVTHESGLFDASTGAMRQLYFVSNMEPIELEQLKDRYYEPNLADKLLGINKEPIRPVKGMLDVKLFPDAELVLVDSLNENYIYITLTNRGGGIGKTTLFINGKEVIEDARPYGFNSNATKALIVINISNLPYFVCGAKNNIEVKTWNQEGYIQSKGTIVRYLCKNKEADYIPKLHVLSIGISDYHGNKIDLRYASKDAISIAKAFELGGKNLFGAKNVHIHHLNTEVGYVIPNRTNILKAFRQLADSCKPADVVVMYFSGHGINHGGSDGDFFYLTQEAFSANPDTYNDIQLRNSLAISSKEITDLAKRIPALKQVLIFDACGSGRAVDNLLTAKDIESSTIRALDRMKDRTGMHIIAGCAANAVSYETSRFGQGLLTYSLLEGIKGAALRESQFQDVAILFQYARDRVSSLAKENGVLQEPRVFSPYGNESFDIGYMTNEDKKNVKLAMPKPLFMRSNFTEDIQMEDVLGISNLLNDKLSELASKGWEATIAFVDVNEFSNGYKVSGRYQVQKNGFIQAKIRIRGDKHDKWVKLKAKNKEQLVELIVRQIDQLFE